MKLAWPLIISAYDELNVFLQGAHHPHSDFVNDPVTGEPKLFQQSLPIIFKNLRLFIDRGPQTLENWRFIIDPGHQTLENL